MASFGGKCNKVPEEVTLKNKPEKINA